MSEVTVALRDISLVVVLLTLSGLHVGDSYLIFHHFRGPCFRLLITLFVQGVVLGIKILTQIPLAEQKSLAVH
jgi:hypothetical protein